MDVRLIVLIKEEVKPLFHRVLGVSYDCEISAERVISAPGVRISCYQLLPR